MIVDTILRVAAPETDRTWFLDHRRSYRLRRDGIGVAAVVRKDGRSDQLAWPDDEPLSAGEEFAAKLFAICEKTPTDS